MKTRKLIALGLAAALGLSVVACGNAETQGSAAKESEQSGTVESSAVQSSVVEEAKDPVTLEWWYRGNGPQQDTEAVEEAFNELLKTYPGMEHVTVNLNVYDSANYAQAVTLAKSANQQIDILNTVGLTLATEVEEGTYIALDDYLAENEALYNELPDWLWELGSIDGSVYIVPNYQRAANQHYMLVPKAYMDKYGDLAKFKEVFNDGEWNIEEAAALLEEFVVAVQAGEGATHYLTPLGYCAIDADFLQKRNDSIVGSYYIKHEGSETVEHKYLTDAAVKAYEISAEWYEKGLIHPDIVGLKFNDFYKQNMMNDISFVNCFVNGAGTEEAIAANYSKQYGFDVYAIALYSNYYIGNTWGAGGNGVTAKCENPEEAVRLIELMTTEEGVELYNMIVYGLEGKHYEKLDDTHIKTLEYDGTQGGASTTYAAMKWIMGNTFHAYLNQGCVDGENEIALDINTNPDNARSDLMGFIVKTDKITTQLEQVTAVTKEYAATLYTGGAGSDWKTYYDEFVAKLNSAGHQEILDELQSQVDAHLTK